MIDVYLDWGGDLGASATGDLMLATNTDAITQRVARRLLTNSGDYIWQLDYGASLGLFVGLPADPNGIEAIVRSQILLETAVPQIPAPTISVMVTDEANGVVTANVTYADPETQSPILASVTTPSGSGS